MPDRNKGDEEIGFIKRYSAARPGGRSPSLFKVYGKVVTSESTKFVGSVWLREEIPNF